MLFSFFRAFVVTSTQNHWIIHLFNIIEILNKYKIFQDHRIRKFSNNIDSRKQDFLSPEKSERSRFVNKDIMQSSLFTFVKMRERSLIFSGLKKSTFLKSMFLTNLAFDVINTGNEKFILKIILRWCLNRYYSMILSRCNYLVSFFLVCLISWLWSTHRFIFVFVCLFVIRKNYIFFIFRFKF